MRRCLLAFLFCAASLYAGETFTAESPPTASQRLSVQGNQLLFAGKPIRLRGVAVGDPIQSRQDRPAADDYATIRRDWHANVVRIAIHPMYWKTLPHDQVLARLAEDVDAALAAGLFVIIEYKVIGWPDGRFEVPTWGGPEVADIYNSSFALATSFWDAVAAKYSADGRVLFELWNEAIYSKEDWRPEIGQKWAELKPYHEKLLAVVRKHGDNVVIVSSNEWSHRLTGVKHDLLAGENVAYAWHIYAGHGQNDPQNWAAALDDLQTVAPVIVTEWGFQANTDRHYKGGVKEFAEPFVRDFLEAKQLHSTAWCWHPVSGPPMLESDWRTPNEFGKFVRDYLTKHNP
ncbi:MAG: cellulase family glycosylhydrolase [Planctomycetaceae bacterium]|nr:cellulase family glycosylhydrolase [Planctomycetaceae bacterium]